MILRSENRLFPTGAGGFRVLGALLLVTLLSAPVRGEDSVFRAAENGLLEEVRRLWPATEDPDTTDATGRTPLWYASSRGHRGVVDFLVSKGADVDASDRFDVSPLVVAVRRGFPDAVDALIAAGARVNPPPGSHFIPLHVAVEQGHAEIVFQLLNAGADPLVDQITGDPANDLSRNAMIRSRIRGMTLNSLLILGAGAETTMTFDVGGREGEGVFGVEDQSGRLVFERVLPETPGPRVTLRWDHRDSSGIEIAEGEYRLRVRFKTGEPIESRRRAIHVDNLSLLDAAPYAGAEVVRAICDGGSDPNERDKQERTALMIAAAFGNTEAVRVLIELGADLETVDKEGRTAFDYAERYAPGQKVGGLLKRAVERSRISR